jgi:hypothetical protein
MDHTCQHCGELIIGNAYRVRSEDQGIRLLDLVVCCLCSMEAKRLRLHTEEINVRSKQALTRSLRRSEVWVDNRLRRLSRAILPGRGRGIEMIEAAKAHLGKVTPKQPVRARSSGRRMLQRRIGTQP